MVFVFGGCEHAEGAVASSGVVEPVDVVADGGGKLERLLENNVMATHN